MKQRILIYTVLSLVTCVLNAQDVTGRKVTWDYPVKPGTNEWKSLDSYKARVDACLIPERLPASLSTAELTDLCLQYPLRYDIFSFNTRDEGIKHIYDSFNGLRELYKRKDAPKELLKQYNLKIKELPLLNTPATSIEKGDLINSISIIELLLSGSGSYGEDRAAWKEILQGLVAGYEIKCDYADFIELGFAVNYFSRIRMISLMDKTALEQLPPAYGKAVFMSGEVDAQTLEVLDRLSYQLIK
jgi:hypothetical protein